MDKKKVISIVLTGAFLIGGGGVGLANQKPETDIIPISAPLEKVISAPVLTNFSDIEGHWAYKDIIALEPKGIMQGVNGKFEPDKILTGTEFVAYLEKVFNFNNNDLKVIQEPSLESITRIEVAKAIEKSFKAKKLSVMMTLMFPVYDDTISLTPEESSALSFVFNTGIMKGRTEKNFYPLEPINKAELAAVLNRTLCVLEIAEPIEENINEVKEKILTMNGVIAEVGFDENYQLQSILVENTGGSTSPFDKVVFLISDTKIIKGDIGTNELHKGQKISVDYVDGPITKIYPARIQAKTIKILE